MYEGATKPLVPKPGKRRRRRLFRRLALGLLFLVVVGGVFASSLRRTLVAVDPPGADRAVQLSVPKGATAQEIGELLTKHGLIRNQTMWVLAASREGYTQRFQAGDYTLRSSMDGRRIMEELTHGTVKTVSITVPEGSNLTQIAQIAATTGLCTATEFEKLARDPKRWPKMDFPLPKRDLEGYLFPDTYPIDRDANAEEILRQMLARFGSVYHKHKADIGKSQLSLHEIVTLASIVEREVKVPEERPKVAQVFLLRLDKGMRLESCATVQFFLKKSKPILTNADVKAESPYNTYLHEGLPPGPIASPGEPCIEAVLHPSKTDYLYFHTIEGQTRQHFSRSLSEHEATKEKG